MSFSNSPQERVSSSDFIKPLTPSATDLKELHSVDHYPRALWVGTAGTATMTDAKGNTLTDFPLKQGENPIIISALTALGTAGDVWGMW